MKDKRGVFMKYRITKADGGRVDPEACYFVLRLDKDPAARKAMVEYAEHCGNQTLYADIYACIDELERPPCNCREAACPHEPYMGSRVWRYGESPAEDEGESAGTSTNNERAAALDIVKQLAAWCEKFPESSTSPFSGIKQFREIEDAAKRLVESLNAETGTSPVCGTLERQARTRAR